MFLLHEVLWSGKLLFGSAFPNVGGPLGDERFAVQYHPLLCWSTIERPSIS
jgi:hypothetical protein